MTKVKPNRYSYITIEDVEGLNSQVVVGNPHEFSIHLNDKVILKFGDQEHYRAGRVIRRSDVHTDKVQREWEIVATSNQFPVADHPVQPELPVVPNSVKLHELTKTIEDTIIKLRMLL